MQAMRVIVSLPGETDYDVRIGSGSLDELGSALRRVPGLAETPQLLVITDENVERLYLSRVMAALADGGFAASSLVVPAGEGAKSVEVAGEAWDAMAGLGPSAPRYGHSYHRHRVAPTHHQVAILPTTLKHTASG